jgi:hypothetical protein
VIPAIIKSKIFFDPLARGQRASANMSAYVRSDISHQEQATLQCRFPPNMSAYAHVERLGERAEEPLVSVHLAPQVHRQPLAVLGKQLAYFFDHQPANLCL